MHRYKPNYGHRKRKEVSIEVKDCYVDLSGENTDQKLSKFNSWIKVCMHQIAKETGNEVVKISFKIQEGE